MSEQLFTCPMCSHPGFTRRGLRAHFCSRGGEGTTSKLTKEEWQVIVDAPPRLSVERGLIIIGCGKKKSDTPEGPVAAKDLYIGPLFKLRRSYAEATGIRWMILSAKYGLIHPDTKIESYDVEVSELDDAARSDVQSSVIRQLLSMFGSEEALSGLPIEIHAGVEYVRLVDEVTVDFMPVITSPVERLGIGEQIAFYRRACGSDEEIARPVSDDHDRIRHVDPERLIDSPTQPRKSYNAATLKDLADNVAEHGIIQPLIARILPSGEMELVAGHRRKRAAILAKLQTAPVLIRCLSDVQVREIQLIENIQRDDINPIDEAESLRDLLELRNAEGQTIYDRSHLARKIGKSEQHIGERLRLLRLPKEGLEAIQSGTFGEAVGYLIAKVPDSRMRVQLTKEVVRGFGDGPMSHREVRDHVRRSYVVELRAAPFDQADATLVPEKVKGDERIFGGACVGCPFNSAYMPESDEQKIHLCTLPPCHSAKIAANLRGVKEAALASGAVVIEGEQAKRYIYHDGTPLADSGMVNIDKTPVAAEVVGTKKPPVWRKMLEAKLAPTIEASSIRGKDKEISHDSEVRIKATVVLDDKGNAHYLVPRKLAIEAAKKNGYEGMFSARASRSKSTAQAAEQGRNEEDKKKKNLESAIAVAAFSDLLAEISRIGVTVSAWVALLEVALFHAASDAQDFVCRRRDLPVKKDRNDQPDREGAIRAHLEHMDSMRTPALVIELLLAAWIKCSGIGSPGFLALARVYKLDLSEIRKRVKLEASDKKPRSKPKAAQLEKPVRELIAELSKKRRLTFYQINEICQKTIGKGYIDAAGSELNQICDAIKEIPIPEKKKKGTK